MSYQKVIDLTQKAQTEKEALGPRTPFADPDASIAEATVNSLPETLQRGLKGLGWPGLMPVQSLAIPYILAGRDLVVQSRTGSGKTGAFLLPMLERLSPDVAHCQALVLCPTRELARQIYDEFQRMNAGLERPLRAVPVYGGTAYGPQIDAFNAGAHLVIGTPGRVLDHITRGTLRLDKLQMLVLDEADEMLSMGFYPDMLKLRRFLPKERTGYMFSATMPYAVQRVGMQFLSQPVFLATAGGQIHVDLMTHRAYTMDPRQKDRALIKLIEWENPSSAIIFANTRREVDYLSTFLSNYGYSAAAISSDLTQKAREGVMGRMRRGELRFLIATDVAARGIDVTDLSHVFQYDVPQDREYYVHRSGRTARAGKAGVSISLITPGETRTMRDIARRYDLPMEWNDLPADDALASRVSQRITRILENDLRTRTNLERERQDRFIPVVRQLVEEGEPEILAMLLDRVYQASLNEKMAAPTAPDDESDVIEFQEPAHRQPQDDEPGGRSRRRSRDEGDGAPRERSRRNGQGDEPEAETDADGGRSERRDDVHTSDDAPEPVHAASDDASNATDGEAKKTRRKRSRSRRKDGPDASGEARDAA